MTKRFLRIISLILITALFITSCRFGVLAIDEDQMAAMSVAETEPEGEAADTESFGVENLSEENSEKENIVETTIGAIADFISETLSGGGSGSGNNTQNESQSGTSAEQEGETSSENIIKIDDEKPAEATQNQDTNVKASPSNVETVELTSDPVDGIKVSVIAPVGTLPEGVTLSVKKVESTDYTLKDIDAAVDNTQLIEGVLQQDTDASNDENVGVEFATGSGIVAGEEEITTERYTLDIKILDVEGNEVQPNDTVQVKFTPYEVKETISTARVYHIEENTVSKVAAQQKIINDSIEGNIYSDDETLVSILEENGEGLDGEVINNLENDYAENTSFADSLELGEQLTEEVPQLKDTSLFARELNAFVDEDERQSVIAETSGFSTFVVEFSYGSQKKYYDFTEYEHGVSVSEIVSAMGLSDYITSQSIKSVVSSDSSKVIIVQEGQGKMDWVVSIPVAFDDEVKLSLEYGGRSTDTIEINIRCPEKYYIARVYDEEEELRGYYTSLALALSAAQTSDTIELLKDITLVSGLSISSQNASILNLDLNGKTIHVDASRFINIPASVTLNVFAEDGGKIVSDSSAQYAYIFGNWGTLNIESGTYKTIGIGSDQNIVDNESTGNLRIQGGRFELSCQNSDIIYNLGSLVVDGGEFIQTSGTEVSAVYTENAVEIKGGTFDCKYIIHDTDYSSVNVVISDGSFNYDSFRTGSSVTGHITITGGKYCTSNIDEYINKEYFEVKDLGSSAKPYQYEVIEKAGVAIVEVIDTASVSIGQYTTLEEAFDVANAEGADNYTIRALAPFTLSDNNTYTVNKNMTLALGTFEIKASASEARFRVSEGCTFNITATSKGGIKFLGNSNTVGIFVLGSLNIDGGIYETNRLETIVDIKGTGSIKNAILRNSREDVLAARVMYIVDKGEATVENVSIEGNAKYSCYNEGTLIIKGSDSLLTCGYYALVYNSGTFRLYNGKLTGGIGVESGEGHNFIYDGEIDATDTAICGTGDVSLYAGKIAGVNGLDVDNGTITVSGGIIIATGEKGTAIKSSGILNIQQGEIVGYTGVLVDAGSTTYVGGGTIDASYYGIENKSQNKLIVNGGTITGDAVGIYSERGGEIEITGANTSISGYYGIATYQRTILRDCTIYGTGENGVLTYKDLECNCNIVGATNGVFNQGTLLVTGGKISGTTKYGIECKGGSVETSGDPEISGEQYSIYAKEDSKEIKILLSGGKFTNTVYAHGESVALTINDGLFMSNTEGEYALDAEPKSIRINNGRFNMHIKPLNDSNGKIDFIYGGFFQPDDVENDYDYRLAPDKIVVPATVDSRHYHWVIDDAEAIIYAQWTFGTLEEMMATASAESEVLVRRDVTHTDKNYSFAHNGAILNLNGFDVACASMNTNLSAIKDRANSGAKGVLTVTDKLTVDPSNCLESDPNDVYIPVYDSNTQDYDGKTGYKFFRFATDTRDASEYTKSAIASDSQIAGFPFVMQFLSTAGNAEYDSEAYDLIQKNGHGRLLLKSVIEWNSKKYLFDYTDTGLIETFGSQQFNNDRLQRISLYYKVPKLNIPITTTIRIQSNTGFDREIGPTIFSNWSESS